jgi:hypothetical protein
LPLSVQENLHQVSNSCQSLARLQASATATRRFHLCEVRIAKVHPPSPKKNKKIKMEQGAKIQVTDGAGRCAFCLQFGLIDRAPASMASSLHYDGCF